MSEERLEAGEDGVRADAGRLGAAGGGQHADRADAHFRQERGLVLDHIGQRADEQKLARLGFGQDGHHGGEAGILALVKVVSIPEPE
jgi:hypothetical protein